MNPSTAATVKSRLANSRSGSTGSAARDSTATNPATASRLSGAGGDHGQGRPGKRGAAEVGGQDDARECHGQQAGAA